MMVDWTVNQQCSIRLERVLCVDEVGGENIVDAASFQRFGESRHILILTSRWIDAPVASLPNCWLYVVDSSQYKTWQCIEDAQHTTYFRAVVSFLATA